MKVCNYCGAMAEDDAVQCKSCGASEFKKVCSNCNKQFDGNRCPACGTIAGEKSENNRQSEKEVHPNLYSESGTNIRIDDMEIRIDGTGIQINNKEVLNYSDTLRHADNYKQINITKQADTSKSANTFKQAEALKSGRVSRHVDNFRPIGVPMPAGTAYPVKKKNSYTSLIIFLVAFFTLIIVLGKLISTHDFQSVNKPKIPDLTYQELLTMEGHPKFYGDSTEAKELWKDYNKVKVVKSVQASYNEDALLLITSSYDENEITGVTINLSEIEDKHDIKLEDVLKLICGYFPYDILDNYYVVKRSFHEVANDGSAFEDYFYMMELNDKGKEANKSGKMHLYSRFTLRIIHRNDDDWIAKIDTITDAGNFESSEKGAYKVSKWKNNVDKYRNEE